MRRTSQCVFPHIPGILKAWFDLFSDIYALGMTLYELWYNKDPFELLEPDLVKEMVLEEQLRPERDSLPAIPEELWATIEECWTTDAGSRLSSSTAMHQLQVFAGKLANDTYIVLDNRVFDLLLDLL